MSPKERVPWLKGCNSSSISKLRLLASGWTYLANFESYGGLKDIKRSMKKYGIFNRTLFMYTTILCIEEEALQKGLPPSKNKNKKLCFPAP